MSDFHQQSNTEEDDVLTVFRLPQISSLVSDFKANNSGHIIQLGSVAGREGYAGGSIYCATVSELIFLVKLCKIFNPTLLTDANSPHTRDLALQKHAMHGFTVALMKELVNTPIRVTEIQPGMVETCKSISQWTRPNPTP